ncbi:UNVERIFIED_CONTAM: hypothetical protein Slati_1387800, partial [Sesamum latifolium]
MNWAQRRIFDAVGQAFWSSTYHQDGATDDDRFHNVMHAAEQPLWNGCTISQLAVVTELVDIKADGYISERLYDRISQWGDHIPCDHTFPLNYYNTKKLIKDLGLPMEKIDACRYDCMFYWNDDIDLVLCKWNRPSRNDDLAMNDTRIQQSIFNFPGRDFYVYRSFLNELYKHYYSKYPIIEELVATQFKNWFKRCVKDEINYTGNELLKLHYWGPTAEVTTFPCYFVNGYNFHIERHSVGKSTFNCGVCVKSSSYTDTDSDFYGVLEEVIQLDYPLIPNMQIVLFKCRWVDPVRSMKVHPRYHLVDVNFKKVYQKNEPFILAQQAVQVYYTEYPSMKRDKVDWMAVCKIKGRRVVDDSRWTDVAFQEDETISTPQVLTGDHNYALHDLNGIPLVVDRNQQGA